MSNKNITKEKRKQIKKEKKSTQATCSQCPADLTGLLKQKTFCVFCLHFVCKSHIIKKRQDPAIEDKLAKICQECEDNILYQQIMAKHQAKEQQMKEEDEELQTQLNELNTNIQDIIQKQSSLKQQISNDQTEFEQKKKKYLDLLKDADARQEVLNLEGLQLNEDHRKLMEVKKTVETQRQLLLDALGQEKHKEKQLQGQIEQLDHQLKQNSEEISALNNVILLQKSQTQQTQINQSSKLSQYQKGTLVILSELGPRNSALNIEKKPNKDKPIKSESYWCLK